MKNEYFTVKLTKEIQAELSQSFDCGNPALTAFLKSYEALDDFFGVTYVCLYGTYDVGMAVTTVP